MKNVSDHDHPMHKGPHHDKYIHPDNRAHSIPNGASNTTFGKMMGHETEMDIAGHSGKMTNKGCK